MKAPCKDTQGHRSPFPHLTQKWLPKYSVHANKPLSPYPLPPNHLSCLSKTSWAGPVLPPEYRATNLQRNSWLLNKALRRKANTQFNTNSITSISFIYLYISLKSYVGHLFFVFLLISFSRFLIFLFLFVFHTAELTAPDLIPGWPHHKHSFEPCHSATCLGESREHWLTLEFSNEASMI